MNHLELPITGVTIKTDVPTKINFHGEVDSIANMTKALSSYYKVRNPNLVIKFLDWAFTSRAEGKYITLDLPHSEIIHTYILTQDTLQDFLFISGHEEGHILDDTNNLLVLEQLLLSQNVDIDLSKVKNREVRASLAGLYVLRREGFEFDSLHRNYLASRGTRRAIELYLSNQAQKQQQ